MRRVTASHGKSSSLRERYRRVGRDAILDAAGALFLQRGYPKTTIAAIAERAHVGVATVFRHFKSKEGVLAALSQRDIDKILADAAAAIVTAPADPAQGIMLLLSAVLRMHLMPSTRIRGQTRLWLLIPTGHPETDEVVTSSDRELQAMIQDLLLRYRSRGRLIEDIDLPDATITIFAVFYHHYLLIALNRSVRISDVERQLERRIALLFRPWNPPPHRRTRGR